MSDTKKPSFLTRAMISVDQKMGRTPSEGEVATTESRTDVKNALIGAGLLVAVGASFILGFKSIAKSAIEEEKTDSDETTED